MGRMRIGTASWTDRSLIDCGRFYPADCTTPERRLRYYASRFPLVEVDSTYYALPSERNARLWNERTPRDFVFDIKAFRLFTGHWTPLNALPSDLRRALPESTKQRLYYKDTPEELRDELWRRYVGPLGILKSAGKLGVVLLQFPPWVKPHPRVYEHIEHCRERLAGFDPAVEFRNHTWLDDTHQEQTLRFLNDRSLSYVAVDEPQGFSSSVPPVAAVTGPYAVARFHGRNTSMWERRGLSSSAERFNYYYRREELAEWRPRLQSMRDDAREVHAVFNTNYEDQGPVNAMLLAELLDDGLHSTSA